MEGLTMIASRVRTSLGVTLALFSLGCRQEVPKAPPAPPTPTTSAPLAAPVPAAPAPAAPAPGAAGPAPSASVPARSAEDALVTGRVKAELLKASDGRNIEIDVETQNGVVRLTGFARSNSDIDSALETARKVEGVKDVQHKLAVKPG
jgi:hyperosmotically inducible protein